MGELAYDVAGNGDAAMLFVHGWCCDRTFFAPQFAHFSKTHRVVAVDLPGHGGSAAAGADTIDSLAAAVAATARGLGLGRAVVCGHSLGSMVALALARHAPDLVRAVVMVDPPPLNQEVWAGFATRLVPALEGPDGAGARRKFVEQMFLPTDDAARRAHVVELMCSVPNEIAVPLVHAMATFDSVGALRECAVPILTVGSAVPSNGAKFLLESCPAMAIGQTVGAGHFNQLEVPEQVNAMIERFVAIA